MRILSGLPPQRTPWQARLLAVALGVLGPVVLALSIRVPAPAPRAEARDATERVASLDLPALGEQVVDERVPPLASSGIVPPASPARDRAAPGSPAMPLFPSFPSGGDSTGGGEPAASPRAPGARELIPSPVAGRALCLPPACGGSGTGVAAGAAGGAGVGIVFAPMSREERDSIARAVITAAAAAGGSESHPASTLPPGTAGVSLPVGLPGGGPTRAQRERARVLDADVASRLARIRARADSIVAARRRDSVARVMPRTDDKAVAPDA
jgi:hypothetical protein